MAIRNINAKKADVEECIFMYIALHSEYQFNKNSLLHCNLLGFLPAEYRPDQYDKQLTILEQRTERRQNTNTKNNRPRISLPFSTS